MSNHTELERAQYAALLYLGRRRLTGREMRDKLKRKEYSDETIAQVMAYLEECGYINDSNYVRDYIADAVKSKQQGKVRIRQDLRRRGISPELVEEAFAEEEPDTDSALRELLEIKLKNMDITIPKEKNRLIQFLLRRGFQYDEIRSALQGYEQDEWQ